MSDITDERMATALERIADALERAHPAKFHPGGLIQPPWDIAVEPVPNQPGVFRRVTHAAWDDCERPADPPDAVGQAAVHVVVTNRQTGATLFAGDMAKLPADLDLPQGGWSADDLVRPMADPLDESDHRPRHGSNGDHWTWRQSNRWCDVTCDCVTGGWVLSELAGWCGDGFTFCDCDETDTIEAENGATD